MPSSSDRLAECAGLKLGASQRDIPYAEGLAPRKTWFPTTSPRKIDWLCVSDCPISRHDTLAQPSLEFLEP
jgi:hypothetical protein